MEKLFVAINFGIVKNQQGFSKLNSQLFSMRNIGISTENALKTGMTNIASATTNLTNKMANLRNETQKTGSQVKENLFDKIGQGSFNLNNIVGAAKNIGGMIAPIFKEGMARETAAISFGTLFRDQQAGKEYADQLRNTDTAALYGTSTVNDAAKNMLGFGIDSKTTMDTIQRLGDIAGGDAQKLGSLSLAFAQISSAGKLGGQDLMQLINAGFNPLQTISEKTGKSIKQLKEEMAKGAITAQDVADAIKTATEEGGQFNGMTKNIMDNTLQGKMARFQGMMDDLKAKIFEMIVPIASKLMPVIMDQVIPALDKLMNEILVPTFDFISENFDTILTLVGIIGSLVGVIKIWTTVQTVLNTVMALNPVGAIALAITALIGLITLAVNKYREWGAVLTWILGPFGVLINVIMAVKDHWNSIVAAFKEGGFIGAIKRAGLVLLDALLVPVQQLLNLLSNIPGLGNLAKGGADWIQNMRQNLNLTEVDKKEEAPKEATTTNSTMEAITAAVTQPSNGTAELGNATGGGNEKVASGGTRNTQITINLGSMVENINFQGGIQENKESLTSQVEECLLRVLYSAQTAM